jgi:mRNA interferase MazF
MKRGDIVTVAVSGDCGKPRPVVIIQSDWLDKTDSILVCLISSAIRDAPFHRLTINPTPLSGLREVSQVMVDKIIAMRRDKCGQVIGRLNEAELLGLNRLLALVVGIAD